MQHVTLTKIATSERGDNNRKRRKNNGL